MSLKVDGGFSRIQETLIEEDEGDNNNDSLENIIMPNNADISENCNTIQNDNSTTLNNTNLQEVGNNNNVDKPTKTIKPRIVDVVVSGIRYY